MSKTCELKEFDIFANKLFDENTTLVESSRWSNYLLKTQEDFEIIKLLYKNLYKEK